ncbi:cupredoxin domain-containing protein [Aliiglaciecola sp. LCG003]|uniref:cupredoxin domain-containing protein n=1 Tax=Aliiglaciecola sp. LCG003 TaxID=3053655 RepID=UPI002572FB2A|nr:cupredoxin domain-containing protein [Aliiglaciecola sp. LCG003]WJG11347.1 cupredoxin domain-containing protein [Aliiglaciecola sp. LCG003]
MKEVEVYIKDHLFYPAEIQIPAHQKVKVTFINQDATPEEIDSFDLNREKVIFGNSRASIFVGPLKAGRYRFFGEYHPNSAVGFVQVVENLDAE